MGSFVKTGFRWSSNRTRRYTRACSSFIRDLSSGRKSLLMSSPLDRIAIWMSNLEISRCSCHRGKAPETLTYPFGMVFPIRNSSSSACWSGLGTNGRFWFGFRLPNWTKLHFLARNWTEPRDRRGQRQNWKQSVDKYDCAFKASRFEPETSLGTPLTVLADCRRACVRPHT